MSFVALLRTGEAVGLKMSQGRYCHHANTIILALPASQTAQRSGSKTSAGGRPERCGPAYETNGWQVIRRVFDVTVQNFGQDLDDLACEIRWHCKHLTAYGVRRGGVSWHCVTLHSMDATTYMGRWALSRLQGKNLSSLGGLSKAKSLKQRTASSDSVAHFAKSGSVKHKSTALV